MSEKQLNSEVRLRLEKASMRALATECDDEDPENAEELINERILAGTTRNSAEDNRDSK